MEESLTSGGDSEYGTEPANDDGEPRHAAFRLEISRRVRMVAMMVWCMIVMLALRGVPSIAMQGTGGTIGMGDEYSLSNLEKGNIYAAWGWAYTIGQMPGGAYAQLYGAKNTWLVFMGLSGVSALLIPIGGAVGGYYAIVALSAISGFGQAPLYPGKEALVGNWIPISELSFAQGVINNWWAAGQSIAHIISPFIMVYFGWQYTYISFGLFVVFFCATWQKWGFNKPADDPECSAEEQALIDHGKNEGSDEQLKFDAKLYLAIMMQRPIAAYMLHAVLRGFSASYNTILPLYLEQEGGFSVIWAGIISAIQGFVSVPIGPVSGWMSDRFVEGFEGGAGERGAKGCLAHGLCRAGAWVSAKGVSVDQLRRSSIIFEDLITAALTFVLAMQPSPNMIAFILIFKAIVGPFAGALNRPIMVEMSPKYAAGIMGAVNCADNLTLYALSATLNGWLLDNGGCRPCGADNMEFPGCAAQQVKETTDLNGEHFWQLTNGTADLADSACNIVSEEGEQICISGIKGSEEHAVK